MSHFDAEKFFADLAEELWMMSEVHDPATGPVVRQIKEDILQSLSVSIEEAINKNRKSND